MTNKVETTVDQTLERVLDASIALDARQTLLATLRQQHVDLAARIDRTLLQRHAAQTDAIGKLNGIVEDLRATTERLTGAPVHEGVFVAPCPLTEDHDLARIVVSGGREVLLEFLDDSILPALQTGDRVLLSTGGNVVIGKSSHASPGAGECAVVERWLGSDRLVLRQRDQTVVTRAAAALTPASIESGALVRIDPLSGFAMEQVEPLERSPYAAEDDATSLPVEALAGYDDLRDGRLRQISYAIAHGDLASAYRLDRQRPWILLGGPAGVGKSTFARVIAGVLQRETGHQCRVRRLNGAELLSPYVGETEQRIRALVREVRKCDNWSIVFIDEVDAIARARGSAGNVHSDRFLSTWLAELEGFDGRAPCILVAATNRIDMVDAAFRSRCSEEIALPRPGIESARAIFEYHLPPELPYHGENGAAAAMREQMIGVAVARLYLPNAPGAVIATLRFRDGKTRAIHTRELMSGRLIEQICIDARKRAFRRHVEGERVGLHVADIDAAVDEARDRLRATLTPANAHAHLVDLPHDVAVVAVDRAARTRGSVAFLREAVA